MSATAKENMTSSQRHKIISQCTCNFLHSNAAFHGILLERTCNGKQKINFIQPNVTIDYVNILFRWKDKLPMNRHLTRGNTGVCVPL